MSARLHVALTCDVPGCTRWISTRETLVLRARSTAAGLGWTTNSSGRLALTTDRCPRCSVKAAAA